MGKFYKTEDDYFALLDYSLKKEIYDGNNNTVEKFLSMNIFDFTTYCGYIDSVLVEKAIKACEAINNRTTFDLIKDKDDYIWFITILNTPFFIGKIEWGSSIRGAWWIYGAKEIQSSGLWEGDDQLSKIVFESEKDWKMFISAVIRLYNENKNEQR